MITMSRDSSLLTCLRVAEPRPRGTVEPLVLPHTAQETDEAGEWRHHRCRQPIASDLAVVHSSMWNEPPPLLVPPREEGQRIRYRWWVGHHAAFGLWQALSRTLRRILAEFEPSPDLVGDAARMLDCYSVLFLYAGSCSARQYETVLRREMRDFDPAFSGTWARDYRCVPDLLREVKNKHPRILIGPLVRASKVNKLVHAAVAKKLVPNGASLLREAGMGDQGEDMARRHDRYDTFFAVRRQPVCPRAVTAQLIRRLAQVTCDLATTGGACADVLLTGGVVPQHSRWAPAMRRIAEDGTVVLARLADSLARSAADPKGRQ